MARIYVASSWRNAIQPQVVQILRAAGHEVYDFRNPPNRAGFAWRDIEEGWESWTPERFREMLNHPDAIAGYQADFDGMRWADACLLVMPCGRSAHLEAGYFWGAQKPLLILLESGEPELMYRSATMLCTSMQEVLAGLSDLAEEVLP